MSEQQQQFVPKDADVSRNRKRLRYEVILRDNQGTLPPQVVHALRGRVCALVPLGRYVRNGEIESSVRVLETGIIPPGTSLGHICVRYELLQVEGDEKQHMTSVGAFLTQFSYIGPEPE